MCSEFVAYLDLEGECRRVGIHYYSMEKGPLLILRGKWLQPSPSNDDNDKGDDQRPDQDGGPSVTKDEEEFGGCGGAATDFRQDNENPEVKINFYNES